MGEGEGTRPRIDREAEANRMLTTRGKNILGLLAFAAASVLVVYGIRREGRHRLRALAAVPADAFLVITLDVDRLRKSPLGSTILGGADSKLLGEKTLTETCGFDPLDRMLEIAVAVPGEDETGEFGIVMRADISRDELLACAEKVMNSRGAGVRASVRSSGSFTLVEPDGDLQRRYPTLAYREGGPFLVARGTWLGTMIDTTEGRLPSARRESKHLSLRRSLGQSSDDAPTFALMATVVLPSPMRERIKKEMGAEIRAGSGEEKSVSAGILGVESVGLAVLAGEPDGETSVIVEVVCEAKAACAAVAELVEKKRAEWTRDFSIRLLGVGALLDQVVVENRGESLRISTRAPSSEAAKWLGRVLELQGIRHPIAGQLDSGAAPVRSPPPQPDEVVRPRPEGGLWNGQDGSAPLGG